MPLRALQTFGPDASKPPLTCGPARRTEPQTFYHHRPGTRRGHRIHIRKLLLTCRAPLRNRTVDLLLTMNRRTVLFSLVEGVTRQNTSTDQHPQAPDRPTQAQFAPQFDLAAGGTSPSPTQCSKAGATARLLGVYVVIGGGHCPGTVHSRRECVQERDPLARALCRLVSGLRGCSARSRCPGRRHCKPVHSL